MDTVGPMSWHQPSVGSQRVSGINISRLDFGQTSTPAAKTTRPRPTLNSDSAAYRVVQKMKPSLNKIIFLVKLKVQISTII